MTVLEAMIQNYDIEIDNKSVQNEDDMVFVPPKCVPEIEGDINLSRNHHLPLVIRNVS
jgi:hypothetical protein